MTLRELVLKVCKERGWSDERINTAMHYASMRAPGARIDMDMACITPPPGKTVEEMQALIVALVIAKADESDVMDRIMTTHE
jgi:hypothetical protein